MSWAIGRRELLAASAFGAAWTVGGRLIGGAAGSHPRIALALVDSDLPSGWAFAKAAGRAGIRTVSVGQQAAILWRDARNGFGLAPGEAAIGLTSWADWSVLHPTFAEYRKLARVELRVDSGELREAVLPELLAAWAEDGPLRRGRLGTGGITQFAWLVA